MDLQSELNLAGVPALGDRRVGGGDKKRVRGLSGDWKRLREDTA